MRNEAGPSDSVTGEVAPPEWGRIDRRRFLSLSAGAVALPGLLGSRAAGSVDALAHLAKPKRGGSVTWGTTADPVHLSPYGEPLGATVESLQMIYESLVAWDPRTLKIGPSLATKWEIPDNTTYVFHLRPGVKFHSGKPLTADDVKYSLETQKSPPPPGLPTNSAYPHIASVEVVDPMTVKVTQTQPDPTLLGYLAWRNSSFIIPQNMYASDTQTHADGTGPFKLLEYVPNDHVTFTRNTHYWKSGLPYLDKLTFKILPDEPTRLTAIRAGAIDGTTVSTDSAKTLESVRSLNVLKGPVANCIVMYFKLNGPPKPWHDPRVRQAVNFAIDRQAIIDNVFGGQGHFSSIVPDGYGDWSIPQHTLRTKYEKHDKAHAKALLKQAGYPDGFDFTLIVIATPVMYPQIAQVVAAHLGEVGIKAKVQPLQSATFEEHTQVSGDIDCALTGKGIRDDVSGFFVDVNRSKQPWFVGGWSNDKFNNLMDTGLEETSAAKRKAVYTSAQEIVLTELPIMPLVGYNEFQPVVNRLKGMYVAYPGYEPGLTQAWVTTPGS